jgi:hypothetical protein
MKPICGMAFGLGKSARITGPALDQGAGASVFHVIFCLI